MKKHRITAMALAALIAVSTGVLPVDASAVKDNGISESTYEMQTRSVGESREKNLISLGTVQNKSLSAYLRPNLKIHGKGLSVRGFTIGSESYVPFRAVANALGASYSYNSSTKTATMKLSGLTLTASAGCYVAYANGRALFTSYPTVIMSDGRIYIPAQVLTKSTGLLLAQSDSLITIGGTYKPLVSAEAFYREDEVLWLARIIHAESSGEPLLGQIAVGGVVMNRVKSNLYPNTIYSVIFDRKYGVQFSPILNGTIYNTPSYNSILAAKICLEGVDVTSGALFFLHPQISASSWIPKNREYLFTVGRHDFYK